MKQCRSGGDYHPTGPRGVDDLHVRRTGTELGPKNFVLVPSSGNASIVNSFWRTPQTLAPSIGFRLQHGTVGYHLVESSKR
jgi:hypothetical protein